MTVPVKVDAKIFLRFALYDALRVKKKWRLPALFALIMLAFALAAFSRTGKSEGAEMLGRVLLLVGFGLPGGYFASFFLSIRSEIKKMGLSVSKHVYTVTLSDKGIEAAAQNGGTNVFGWDDVYGVYRAQDCTYLYQGVNRAYLLPDRDLPGGPKPLLALAEKHGKLITFRPGERDQGRARR